MNPTNASGMPQMRVALGGWTRRITLIRRVQAVVDGFVEAADYPFTFRGSIQPLSPKEIALKPEGQRAWTWLLVHVMTQSPNIMNPNDQIVYNGGIYKVMGQNDYSLNGFMEYHLVKDYQGDGTTC